MLIGHPVLWVFLAAVAAPLLAVVVLGARVPVVVIEVVLGMVIGPHLLGLVEFEGFMETMFTFGMAMTLFMAGMELDFAEIKGRPLSLAIRGWGLSLALGLVVVGLLHVIPQVHAPLMVTIALCTTGLGVLIPVLRDGGYVESPFGRLVMAAGTLGELGPIVAISLLLSVRYTTVEEVGLLLVFLAIVGTSIAVGLGAPPPRLLRLLSRQMHTSTQLPVRLAILVLAAFAVLAFKFGFESILGAFAAGMVVRQATRGEDGRPLREKIDAVAFGWFFPFFFVGTGIRFDIAALVQDVTTMLMVPAFAVLLLAVRGLPAFLFRRDIAKTQRMPLALSSAVPSLSIIVVISEIGLRTKTMNPDVTAALIGAAILAVLVYPTIAGVMLRRIAAPASGSRTP